MRWSVFLSLCGILGCAEPPDPCAPMCAAATELYGGCLADWGVAWSSAGYEDAEDFRETCDTWAWQTRILEEEAGKSGQIDGLCRERRALFEAGSCDDFTGINWSELPWQSATNNDDDDSAAP